MQIEIFQQCTGLKIMSLIIIYNLFSKLLNTKMSIIVSFEKSLFLNCQIVTDFRCFFIYKHFIFTSVITQCLTVIHTLSFKYTMIFDIFGDFYHSCEARVFYNIIYLHCTLEDQVNNTQSIDFPLINVKIVH